MNDSRSSSPPIRVLHVLPWVTSGGVEKRRVTLARRLGPGFDQQIYCLEARDPLRRELTELGVPVTTGGRNWSLTDWTARRGLTALLARFGPMSCTRVCTKAWSRPGKASLTDPRVRLLLEETSYPIKRSWRTDAMMAVAYRRANAIVGVSQTVVDYIRDKIRPPEDRLHTILNGIEDQPEVPQGAAARCREALGIPPDATVVITVGRMHDHAKRMSDLIRAVGQLASSHSRLYAIIVGDGPDRPKLEALADETLTASDRHRLRFAGYRRDVEVFWRRATFTRRCRPSSRSVSPSWKRWPRACRW